MKPVAQARIAEFQKIAQKKGHTFNFSEQPCGKDISNKFETRAIHYDQRMIDQSIRDAIANIEEDLAEESLDDDHRKGLTRIKERITKMLNSGSVYEKSIFVYSSDTFYFQEDIERMAFNYSDGDGTAKPIEPNPKFCYRACYIVCRCVDTDQNCREMCKWVCEDM